MKLKVSMRLREHNKSNRNRNTLRGRRKLLSETFYNSECVTASGSGRNRDSDEDDVRSYVQWMTSDGRVFIPASKTVPALARAVYEIHPSPTGGLLFERIPVRTEGLVNFPETNSDCVIKEIQTFWEREKIFASYNLTYKRGILLYGPPGSGKSCTIQLIIEDVIKRGGVVIRFTDPGLFIAGMRAFRQIEPDTPAVILMEDIDAILQRYCESEVLNILDGVNEVHKTVFLATTNYPDKLGPRITCRPSRFDKRFRIGFPSDVSRTIFFNHLIQQNGSDAKRVDVKQWVSDTDGMSIAHLKELFVAVIILGDDYDETIKTLQKMTEPLEDKDHSTEIGFGGKSRVDDYYN